MKTVFNIYLTGVGGQGIGLLSEIILRAADHAGHQVKSVDTHGLAQRGGIVVSQIRIGNNVFSPIIPLGLTDLVISLERHEALRAAATVLQDNGCLIYYDTVWQPLSVRLNESVEVTDNDIQEYCKKNGIKVISIYRPNLADIRMQNIVVLAEIHQSCLIPDIELKHYRAAMEDLMSGTMLETNRDLFDNCLAQKALP